MGNGDMNLKCATDEQLSQLLDGDLEGDAKQRLEDHLGTCEHCRVAFEEIEQMAGGLQSLGSAEPPTFLWTRIEQQFDTVADLGWTGRFNRWLAQHWRVPVVATAVGAASVIISMLLISQSPQGPQSAPGDHIRAIDSVMAAEQTYLEAINALEATFQHQKAQYSDDVQQTIGKSLAEMNRAIGRCHKVLRQNPDDYETHRAVLSVYQQKVDLLTDLVMESPGEMGVHSETRE